MKRWIVLVMIFFTPLLWAQTAIEKMIHGRIMADSAVVKGVHVVNLVNEKATVTNEKGDFFILAKAEDLLVFSSVNLEYYRRIIDDEDLKPEILTIKMTAKITELEEVIVNKHPEINAVSLGISPKGIKQYTPAERKLATASSAKLNPQGLDPLINAISGRTKMLKKELEVEKKERLLAYIGALFDDEYYGETLKIPANYIKGFQYYCVEEEEFAKSLRSKNKAMIKLLIVPLAEKYNKIIADEN